MKSFVSAFVASVLVGVGVVNAASSNVIYPNNPLIWYHGRWDKGYGSWWAGTGFNLHVENLSSLSLQLGPNTTSPSLPIGVSVNYGAFATVDVKNGANVIPLSGNSTLTDSLRPSRPTSTVIRINVQGPGDNLYLQKIILNSGARLLPYTPSKLAFQFIGDSLSSGYLLPNQIDGAWPILTSDYFKAEPQTTVQPGACLTDRECWGNVHGISYQFFKLESTSYYYNANHNYTTDWDFRRDYPPTHIFFQAGTNDFSFQVTDADISARYDEFLTKLRRLYPRQPIFALGTWGWPNEDGTYGYFYEGVLENVVANKRTNGDTNVFFVNTRGWVAFDDVYDDKTHLNPQGSAKLAAHLEDYLKNWGLQPQKKWPTPIY
ncbi:hypothetical protein M408DRAFT_204691 [Serendipita vermifera MAFF 305830]|uniref:SGNH hydrolase-type esterase domain-containing protein n=1 Tax=Serendipita vermifera MAFF 305830 TaxID=933852 RepID=A0A0C2X9C3_SERVB|nr:hypothetical protein M408DRAFT_204691 [Serendipita vermifera MAFF 305830]